MVDREVTDILDEIRSRVRASEVLPDPVTPQTSNGDRGATGLETLSLDHAPNKPDYASLTVMARAWDRLPPLVSNRSGVTARLELWIKSKLKAALRWITWEQVNFNGATHQTFLELIESLNSWEQHLIAVGNQLKSQLDTESSARREQFEGQQREIDAQRADLHSEIQTRRDLNARHQAAVDSQQVELNRQRASLSTQQAELNARLTELTTLQSSLNARFDELNLQNSKVTSDLQSQLAQRMEEQSVAAETQLASLVQEFRERDERLLDEQRVCFKQLSLELNESQVLQDRARRDLESRITRLEAPKPK
jgi:hypothetical protein